MEGVVWGLSKAISELLGTRMVRAEPRRLPEAAGHIYPSSGESKQSQ